MKNQSSSFIFHGIVLVVCILIVQSISQTKKPGRTVIKLKTLMSDVLEKCFLETVDTNIESTIDKMVSEGTNLIYIDFSMYNSSEFFIKQDQGSVYSPTSWVLTTGRHGQSLLLLRPHYEILSLRTLSFGTDRIDVSVKQTPMNCLTKYNTTVVSDVLGEFILHKFKTPSINTTVSVATLEETDYICNLNIVPTNGKAIFQYICCHKTISGNTECQKLELDNYHIILFVCIFIMNFIAVMFSPLLIPATFYKKEFETTSYEHRLRRPVTFTVRKISTKEQNSLSVSYFKKMTEFQKLVEGMTINKTYKVNVSTIEIVTGMARLLPSNHVPVGLFESVYKAIVNCEVRDKPSVEGCCESNIFGPCMHYCVFPWYKILKAIMHFVVYLLVGMIWVLRLYFFFGYENTERLDRQNAASHRDLELTYTGNLTWFLTPIHAIFIVCYGIFGVDLILFGFISKHVKLTLKHVLCKCFRDMQEISRTSAFGWSVQILLHPCKHCGIFGFCIAVLYYILAIPVFIVTLSFYFFPTINVIVRLIIYFVAYLLPYGRNRLTKRIAKRLKQLWRYIHRVFQINILTSQESIERPEKLSVKNKILQLIVIFACLLTILSSVLLAMECIVFLVEVCIYSLIGIIVNSSYILKYLSLAILIIFYARDCFNTVTDEYFTFNKFLNGYIVDKMRDRVEKISMQRHSNTAFKTSLCDTEDREAKSAHLMVRNGKLKWQIKSLVLFLDKNNTPYITSKFFFDTCYMEQAGVPGPLVASLLRATQRFMIICVFLFFVVIVILAFGDEFGISATNQMFATLAGGFLPFILKWVLFKQPEAVTSDSNNLSFKRNIQSKLEEYIQNWVVFDIREEPKPDKNDVMLEEIKPTTKEYTIEEVDLLIYHKMDELEW